ncbi:hypothetical protein FPQ18DRAFT_102172 [Pyronema domesticum]|nr:hypothetical protein FPQ18DRAFT_102172 [Pyronema domesticum]
MILCSITLGEVGILLLLVHWLIHHSLKASKDTRIHQTHSSPLEKYRMTFLQYPGRLTTSCDGSLLSRFCYESKGWESEHRVSLISCVAVDLGLSQKRLQISS